MATTFQSCPGCKSLILSDTAACPECGHVFDAKRAKAIETNRESRDLKNQQMYDTCRNCGEQVRSGLVRCFNCNTFMRRDVEARYQEMQSTPQQIIFSDIPKDQRTEYLTAEDRAQRGLSARIYDADENEFSLRDGGDEFELDSSPSSAQSKNVERTASSSRPMAKTPAAEIPAIPATPAKPEQTSATPAAAAAPSADTDAQKGKTNTEEPSTTRSGDGGTSDSPSKKSLDDFDADDLVGIALQDQKETKRRKRAKIEDARKRKILLPCNCGAWVRVREDQSGRTVRCQQCKTPMVVPALKKKEKTEKKEAAPQLDVNWIDDIHLHVVLPTQISLKPGSLQKGYEAVDACFHKSGMFLVKYTPPKKSLFGKAADCPPDLDGQRAAVRQHIQKTGAISNLPFGELFSIPAVDVSKIRLVQPVANAHESMFAGVAVFGEGQIAVYLPVDLPDGKQAYLSFPLSIYRDVARQLEQHFDMSVGAEKNGVPGKEAFDVLKCFLSEVKIESLKNVEYYQNDPGFVLEVSGFVCSTCGSAITEDARARKKLGGATGKGLAKAKCPKCSNKFGPLKAYKIAKAPGDDAKQGDPEEDVSEVLRPRPAAKASSSATAELTADRLQGQWRMVSVGKNGNFANPDDMSAANILFEVKGDTYTVSVSGNTVEQGTIKFDLSQTPAHMDQHVTEGDDKGKSHLGLVRLVEGRLQNCQGDIGQARPVSFESSDNQSASLATFERV